MLRFLRNDKMTAYFIIMTKNKHTFKILLKLLFISKYFNDDEIAPPIAAASFFFFCWKVDWQKEKDIAESGNLAPKTVKKTLKKRL